MNSIPKLIAPGKLIFLFVVFIFAVSSCERGKDPLYSGTWQYVENITTDNLTFTTTRVLILTRSTYQETYQVEREGSASISSIIGIKGNLEPTHSMLVFHLKELGTCVLDELDACTGVVDWYPEGSGYWDDNIRFFNLTVPGQFDVDETTLRLTRDLNNDQDFEDAGEDVVFTRI